jgi:hypothetical protein
VLRGSPLISHALSLAFTAVVALSTPGSSSTTSADASQVERRQILALLDPRLARLIKLQKGGFPPPTRPGVAKPQKSGPVQDPLDDH